MCYQDFPRPPEHDGISYLTSEQFLKYIESYADHYKLRKHIKFNTSVKEVKCVTGTDGETEWDWISKETSKLVFDTVAVANGHFTTPNHPSFEGDQTFEGKIMHSHDYRDSADFKGQRVLVIGGSFSALDITMDIAKWATEVTMSHRVKNMEPDFPDNVRVVPDVKNFHEKGVVFINGVQGEFDSVVLCKGFVYNFPFLHESCKITTDGYGVEPLYKHFIHIERPSMRFISLCNYNMPCQLSDLQARFFYNMLCGKVTLPSKEEKYADLRKDQKYRKEVLGWPAQQAHKLGPLLKALYSDLAEASGVDNIKPVIYKLFMDCVIFNDKFQDLRHFRDRVFTIKNDYEYEASPPFGK